MQNKSKSIEFKRREKPMGKCLSKVINFLRHCKVADWTRISSRGTAAKSTSPPAAYCNNLHSQ